MRILLVGSIVIGLATLASVIGYSLSLMSGIDDLKQRVAVVEEQIEAAQGAEANTIAIVTSTYGRDSGEMGRARCVRYVILGQEHSLCATTPEGNECLGEAGIGERIPECLRR